jgi:hypothetical protein
MSKRKQDQGDKVMSNGSGGDDDGSGDEVDEFLSYSHTVANRDRISICSM